MRNLRVINGGRQMDAELYGDFTVDEKTGEAFISIRKAAELMGVAASTLQKRTAESKTSRGLAPNLLQKSVQYYAYKGNKDSQAFLDLLLEAGAKAYIYHEAGYQMDAKPRAPTTLLEALKLAVEKEEEVQALQDKLEAAQPAIKFHSMMHTQNKTLSMNEYAKVLTDSAGVKIGQNKMMAYLRRENILMKGRDATEKNRPYQRYMNVGWFEVNCVRTRVGMRTRPLITPKGQEMLGDRIVNEFDISKI